MQPSVALPERLRTLRAAAKLSQDDVARRLGVTRAAYSKYETGKSCPNPDALWQLAQLFAVTIDDLLGVGGVQPARVPDEWLAQESIPTGPMVLLPVYGEIRAGIPSLAQQEVENWEMEQAKSVMDGEYYYLRVKGDSMIGAHILPGSLVLVRKQDYVENGDIAVVMVNDEEATLKRVQYVDKHLALIPANDKYLPVFLDERDVRILGKVVKTEVIFT